MIGNWLRVVALIAVWLFVAAVLAQVFFAGSGLFVDSDGWEIHVQLGWILHLAPLLILLLVALSRPGKSTVGLAALLALVVFVQPILPSLRGSVPLAAALHPVLALVIFSLAVTLALRLMRSRPSAADVAVPAASV